MKFTWGHGIVVALGLFISFILYLIFVFPIGKQNSELVTENYYEDELSYQKVIDAKNNAATLTANTLYALFSYGIRVAGAEEIKNQKAKIEYYLYRTNDKTQDKTGSVQLDADNSFLIPKKFKNWKKEN